MTKEYQFDYNFYDNGFPESFCPVYFHQCIIETQNLAGIGQMCIDDTTAQKAIKDIGEMAKILVEFGVHKEYDFDKWIQLTDLSVRAINEKIEWLHSMQEILKMFLDEADSVNLLTKNQSTKVANLEIHPMPGKTHLL